MNLTDTHTHLHFDQYQSDIDAVIKRAQSENVQQILTLGTDIESSQASLTIANKFLQRQASIPPMSLAPSRKIS